MGLSLMFYAILQTVHENGIREPGLRCSGQAGWFKMSFFMIYGWTNDVSVEF